MEPATNPNQTTPPAVETTPTITPATPVAPPPPVVPPAGTMAPGASEYRGMPYLVAFTLVLLAAVLGAIGMYFYEGKNIAQEQAQVPIETVQEVETVKTYSNPNLGIEFEYGSGYAVEERNATTSNTIVLIRSEDIANIPEGGEGPPVITIVVVKNTKKQTPLVWAQQNKIYSNINLAMGSTTDYVLDGVSAIRYTTDGLYLSDNVVVAHGENIYVFTGAYLDADSDIRKNFYSLLETVVFTPEPGQE